MKDKQYIRFTELTGIGITRKELEYKNSPEKIKAIKEKYKNGVTEEILKEMFLLEIK